jgi:hypothetical protein
MTKVGGGVDLGLTCMGHAVRESGVGLTVASGPIPNSYPLKFLASCALNGGRILSQFENEPSFVETWGCVSLLAWLHVFTSCPQLFLEAVRLSAYEYVLRGTLLCLLRGKSLAVTVTLLPLLYGD